MATVSTFNIALIASTSRFVSSMAKAERQWNSFARSVQRQAKTLPKAIQEAVPAALTLGRQVRKWTAVATAAITGLSAAGVKLAADFEQSQIAFETMLGSAERANRFLRELEVYARRTPFGFAGLQQAARQLLAYGFTAERVLEMITPIGDTVAAMGGSQQMLEAIIRALGQIQAKGKLAAQEFLQLTEQGVAAWQMLAEFLGVSVPEAMDLASRGAISATVAIEAVLQGMTRRFAGAMSRQADTIAGRWEQIKDSVTTIIRGWGQDVVRITGLAAAMGVLADAVERVAEAVSLHGFLNAFERAFPPWVVPVIVAISGAIMSGLVPAIVAWLIPALKKLGISLWATLRPLTPWMAVGAAVALVAYALARNWGNLAEVGQRVWTVLGGVAMYGASLVVRGSALIYQALSWIVPALRDTAGSVMAYANSLRDSALEAIRSATASARVAQQAAQSVFTAEQAAQAQENLAAGLEAAQAAAEGGIQSFDEVHQVQEGLLDAFEFPEIMPLDVSLPEIDAAASMAEGLASLEGVITGLSDAAARAWGRLVQSMEPVQKAVEWLRANWPGLNTVVEETASLLTLVLAPALTLAAARATWSAAKQVAAWVATQAQAVASIATQVAQMAVLAARWIWLGAQSVAQGARVAAAWVVAMGPVGWVVATAAAVAAAVWFYWDEIVAAIDSAHHWLAATVGPVWDGVRQTMVAVWDSLVAAASASWRAIRGAVEAVMAWAQSAATSVWEGIKAVTISVWEAMVAAASATWSGIRAAMEPVMSWAAAVIGAVWRTVGDEVIMVWEALRTAAESIWHAIKAVIAAVTDWNSETAAAAWQAVTDAIRAQWELLRATAEAVWSGIRSIIETVWMWAQQQAGAVWDAVASTIRAAWNTIASAASTIWSALASEVEERWTRIRGAVTAGWEAARDTVASLSAAIVQTVSGMVAAVESLIDGMRQRIVGWWENLRQSVTGITGNLVGGVVGFVQHMYDVIVGNSIVPDMVMEVTDWFGLMDAQTTGIVTQMSDAILRQFGGAYTNVSALSQSFGSSMVSWADTLSISLETSFSRAFAGIIQGTMSFSQAMSSLLGSMAGEMKNLLVGQVSQIARQSLGTLAQWVSGVLSQVATSITAMIQQAYATLVAFFAWSGPAAPALATGVIAAAVAGIGALASQVIGSIPGLARGGIVTGPTLAMIGEGYRREAVIPLERDNVIAESVGAAVFDAMMMAQRFQQASGGSQAMSEREVVLRIDGAAFARLILPHLVREGQRQGVDVTLRPVPGV